MNNKRLTGDISAIYDWKLANNITNTSLMGIDYLSEDNEFRSLEGMANPINLINPNYGNDEIVDEFITDSRSRLDSNDQLGIYLQNQMTINDKWVAVLGARHDRVDLRSEQYVTSEIQDDKYNATTGRVGLVYLMDNGVAPYASINQSFEVNLGLDRNGDTFKPTKGTQYEVGVRYQPEGKDTLLTGSLYRIDQTDVLVDDPIDDNFQIQFGEVRSQGMELEAKTQIGDNANLIAAYSYTDARTIKSSPLYPEEEGLRVDNVPYNKFSLWGDYRFTDYGMPQLKIGSGIRYIDSAMGIFGSMEYPSFTVVDAMASYDWSDNLQLSFNIKNLLDKEYVTCGAGCFYGEPRNIVGKVTYKW